VPLLRKWDLKRTQAIPRLATSCRNMADEIQKVYGRQSTILYPPVEVPEELPPDDGGDYYLSVSRLISHKRVELAVQASVRSGRKLVVAGDGMAQTEL